MILRRLQPSESRMRRTARCWFGKTKHQVTPKLRWVRTPKILIDYDDGVQSTPGGKYDDTCCRFTALRHPGTPDATTGADKPGVRFGDSGNRDRKGGS